MSTLVPLGAAILLAVVFTTFSGGGFSNSSQDLFVVFTGVALVFAVPLTNEDSAAGPARYSAAAPSRGSVSPVSVILIALGLLSAASAVWTITQPSEAIRSGLVVMSYGSLTLASRHLALRTGPWPFALGLLIIAVLEAILGLQAEVRHSLPDAERIYGVWRPGGTFEYQPALALLEVAALPVVVMLGSIVLRRPEPSRDSQSVAPQSSSKLVVRSIKLLTLAGAALILGIALARSGTRLEVALGAVTLVLMLLRPPTGARRLAVVGVAVCLIAGGAGADVAFHHHLATVSSRHHANTRHHGHAGGSHVIKLTGKAPKATGFWHGRLHEWSAAISTWEDRPLIGAGAGSYLAASIKHQGQDVSRYAHDLPLEEAAALGIGGFLLCVALYFGVVRELIRARGTLAFALLGSITALFLISNLVDWTWHLAGLGAIWAAATGALCAACKDPVATIRRT